MTIIIGCSSTFFIGVQADGNYLDRFSEPMRMWIAYVKVVQADDR